MYITSNLAVRRLALGALAGATLILSGCSSLNQVTSSMSNLGGLITPYRMDIVQGNVVVREQVQALQPGMARAQVQDILGTPLLASAFHAERWDYVFTFKRQGQEPQMRRVTVFFAGDVLTRVEADELPSEEEFVAALDVRRNAARVPVLQATPEQLQAFRDRHPLPATQPATPPAAARTQFPPLEPR